MRHRSIGLSLVATVVFAGGIARADGDLNAAPPGLAPTNITAAQLLRFNSGARPLKAKSGHEQLTVSFGSLTGTTTETWDSSSYRTDEILGPFHTAYGRDAHGDWHMNENGEVVRDVGFHVRDAVDERALRDTSSPGITVLGTVTTPVNAYVVRVDPSKGRLEYLFYDRSTYRLVRREEIRDGRRITYSYADFHPVGAYVVPFTTTIEDGKPENIRTLTMVAASFGDPVLPSAVSAPTPAPPIVSFPSTVATTVPAKVDADRVILQFKISGRAVDLQLDSGAAGVVINDQVVKALGFKQYGKVTGSTAGDYAESGVVIPELDLGKIILRNVYARSVPFAEVTSTGTPVAGLMGFDVLDEAVVHVDYLNGTVEMTDPAHFSAPPGAVALPAAFDDDVPAISLELDGIPLRMILDTGADRSTLFSVALRDHPNQFPETGLGELMQSAWPFVNQFYGVGGKVDYRPLQTGPLAIGAWTFDRWLFNVTQNDPTFEFEDYDGLIGQDLLRFFDLYLDEPHGKIYLVPNQRYHDRFG